MTNPTTMLPVPTREQFHRTYAGIITQEDFNTEHPNPNRLGCQMAAYRFNKSLQTLKNWNWPT